MDAERLLRHLGDVAGMPGLFFEAAETERKLPGVVKKRYSVAWPDYVPDPGLAYGYGEFEVRMPPADAAEIFRYDCALELARWRTPRCGVRAGLRGLGWRKLRGHTRRR